MNDLRLITNVITVIAVFGVLASLWLGLLLVVSARRAARSQAVEQRLGIGKGVEGGTGRVLRLWLDGRPASTVVRGDTHHANLAERLHAAFEQAGYADARPFILGVVGFALLGSVVAFALSLKVMVALSVAGLVFVGAWWHIGKRIAARRALFENQLVDALSLAARSLRAGHPLLGAFQLISEELADPVKSLFASICQQHAMGLKLEEAIERACANAENEDVHLFSTAVVIQLRSGGNLADVMDRLAEVIRDRVRIGRRVRVLTAQTQFSKRVLIGLPIVLFFVLYIINPEYMSPLIEDTAGQIMLATASVSLVLGVIVMNKLSVLKY